MGEKNKRDCCTYTFIAVRKFAHARRVIPHSQSSLDAEHDVAVGTPPSTL